MEDSKNKTPEESKSSPLAYYLRGLIDYKWLLLIAYYFYFDLGQEMFDINSEERINFFYNNQAAWFLIFSLFMWTDGKKLMPRLSQHVYKAVSLYFTWDLLDNIINNGARVWRESAMQLSVIFFILLAVNFIRKSIKKAKKP